MWESHRPGLLRRCYVSRLLPVRKPSTPPRSHAPAQKKRKVFPVRIVKLSLSLRSKSGKPFVFSVQVHAGGGTPTPPRRDPRALRNSQAPKRPVPRPCPRRRHAPPLSLSLSPASLSRTHPNTCRPVRTRPSARACKSTLLAPSGHSTRRAASSARLTGAPSRPSTPFPSHS